MIGTRILKIDSEIAEIIEVKVGNHHLEIYILVFHRGRKIISMLKVATLISIISAISKSNFKILVPIMQQISQIFKKRPNFCILHDQKPTKEQITKCKQFCWTPCTHDNTLQAGYNERGNKRKGAAIHKSWQQSRLLFLHVPDFGVFHTVTMNG